MRTITAKVNKTVRYRLADGRWVPAQIASIVAGTTVNLRLASGATQGSVALGSPATPAAVGIWMPY